MTQVSWTDVEWFFFSPKDESGMVAMFFLSAFWFSALRHD